MTILFIILSLLLIFFLIGKMSVTKKAKSASPLNSIRWDGTLGIRIGDKYEFVLSRLRHLDLKFEDYAKISKEFGWTPEGDYDIKTADHIYNNVAHIYFGIKNNICKTITIQLYPQQADIEFLRKKAARMISANLGIEGKKTTENEIYWLNKEKGFLIMISPKSSIIICET